HLPGELDRRGDAPLAARPRPDRAAVAHAHHLFSLRLRGSRSDAFRGERDPRRRAGHRSGAGGRRACARGRGRQWASPARSPRALLPFRFAGQARRELIQHRPRPPASRHVSGGAFARSESLQSTTSSISSPTSSSSSPRSFFWLQATVERASSVVKASASIARRLLLFPLVMIFSSRYSRSWTPRTRAERSPAPWSSSQLPKSR